MIEIFLKTVPFFALIGCGYGAARIGLFGQEAVAHLTRFVFYFALSAMLFNFSASLELAAIFDPSFAYAYTAGTAAVYIIVLIAARFRGVPLAEASVEAQCGVIGNIGFLGLPMLVLLLGEAAAAPLLMMLCVDLILFGSLLVIIIVASREGRIELRTLWTVGRGLISNPMVVSMIAGLTWSSLSLPIPAPAQEFLDLMGGAATPCALFAIGASLVARSAERVSVALWLSTAKLVLHPAAIAVLSLWVFAVDPFAAAVMIASAAMPTAGNIYIVAQHYGVAPARASSTILVSTVISVVTLSLVIALVLPLTI